MFTAWQITSFVSKCLVVFVDSETSVFFVFQHFPTLMLTVF